MFSHGRKFFAGTGDIVFWAPVATVLRVGVDALNSDLFNWKSTLCLSRRHRWHLIFPIGPTFRLFVVFSLLCGISNLLDLRSTNGSMNIGRIPKFHQYFQYNHDYIPASLEMSPSPRGCPYYIEGKSWKPQSRRFENDKWQKTHHSTSGMKHRFPGRNPLQIIITPNWLWGLHLNRSQRRNNKLGRRHISVIGACSPCTDQAGNVSSTTTDSTAERETTQRSCGS